MFATLSDALLDLSHLDPADLGPVEVHCEADRLILVFDDLDAADSWSLRGEPDWRSARLVTPEEAIEMSLTAVLAS